MAFGLIDKKPMHYRLKACKLIFNVHHKYLLASQTNFIPLLSPPVFVPNSLGINEFI